MNFIDEYELSSTLRKLECNIQYYLDPTLVVFTIFIVGFYTYKKQIGYASIHPSITKEFESYCILNDIPYMKSTEKEVESDMLFFKEKVLI